MTYSIVHSTEYLYADYVSYCHNMAILKPRPYIGQKLLDFNLEIDPGASEITERVDFLGNYATWFSIQKLHKRLLVTSRCKIVRNYESICNTWLTDACREVTLQSALEMLNSHEAGLLDAKHFRLESPLIRKVTKEARQYAQVSFKPERSVFEAANELMQRIYSEFEYVPGFTNIATPLNEVLMAKKGVCQDFAHVAIACIRSVGLPARYISGYIETVPLAGTKKLIGADASHAWFAIFIPGFDWVEFDPTNNLIPENQHVVVATGRDYYDVPPLKGVIFGSGNNSMKVAVNLNRVAEG
ncbi:MAG: transglutaminase family protein [Bacteroidales bacterium]|nr:transglutaminase family protein [Bacteroidales bacterium]